MQGPAPLGRGDRADWTQANDLAAERPEKLEQLKEVFCYEYNLFIMMRIKIRSQRPLPAGKTTIGIETVYAEAKPGGPLNVTITVDGDQVATGLVPVSAPLLLSANDCLDIGTALGSPVSLDYCDRAPFPFEGTIHNVNARYHS